MTSTTVRLTVYSRGYGAFVARRRAVNSHWAGRQINRYTASPGLLNDKV